ncbi:MAG TPA: NUDIX domain-containing protein [Thermomicrobiaceae bacterium]|nr:NUDIX domain-containing protein [Thermomicrobiaceae bacterium]
MEAARPDRLEAYSLLLLTCQGRYLLLRRAAGKRFAPGRWTGIGGRVEPDELGRLRASALRELVEETGLPADAVTSFALRRVLVHARPGEPLTVLLYFTGTLGEPVLPECAEGTLAWVRAAEIADLDVIENTAQVIPRLIEDLARDPHGREPVVLGLARYAMDGSLERVVWA